MNTLTKKALTLTALVLVAAFAQAATPREIYDKQCAKCHGKEGKGDTAMGRKSGAKDYSDAKVQEALTDEAAFKAIKDGFKDKSGKVQMKPAEDLTDDQIKELVKLLRTFKK